jgi:hypothetical protein
MLLPFALRAYWLSWIDPPFGATDSMPHEVAQKRRKTADPMK